MRRRRYKTARCVLHHQGEILLAVHSSFWGRTQRRWGLPGGNIEWREDPEKAARREIYEEFDVHLTDLTEIGAFPYKGHQHMVYWAEVDTRLNEYDDTELLDIRWFEPGQILTLRDSGELHAGYEWEAIDLYLKQSRKI